MTNTQHVHVVFKTHFDFGFTDFARAVRDQYFDTFIPKVLDLAQQLRDEDAQERYIWTTGSWLIYNYLEEAGSAERRRMEEAIAAGDITWHALPFTTHSELMDASLFRYGLSLSQALDDRFGVQTIAAKMTDVPGHTRGIVPLLAEAGIEFLHIGVNEAATPPDVPPIFRWQDPSGAEIIVMYQHAYGASIQHHGLEDALAFGFTEDNVGPQTIEEVRRIYRTLEADFPGADVFASTLDDFGDALIAVRETLPIVTAEIGDTWIHGAGTDPMKVAQYRALSRLRQDWVEDSAVVPNALSLHRFSARLLCLPEHTWGLDEKTHLDDYIHYSNEDFARVRQTEPFQKMEASWAEQREYVNEALGELDDVWQYGVALDAVMEVVPERLSKEDFEPIADISKLITTTHLEIGIDAHTGSIWHLKERATRRLWANRKWQLGVLSYQTFSEEDYNRYLDEYLASRPEWGILDNSKPGIRTAGAVSRTWNPELQSAWKQENDEGITILLELADNSEASRLYGCPKVFNMLLHAPAESTELVFDIMWFDKTACRLPEALWCSFVPYDVKPNRWKMEKMGQLISPMDVVSKGNRALHAIDRGIFYRDERSVLNIESLDAPLVAPGKPALLRFENNHPDLSGGWHFNLFNNVWGTNFPMWYDDDARFRFILELK